VRILAVSDAVVEALYSTTAKDWLGPVDLIVGCGDVPYWYLEFLLTVLGAPLYYVHGNHDPLVEYSERSGAKTRPEGGVNVDRRTVTYAGLILGGLEGCVEYRPDARHQYTQSDMRWRLYSMLPGLVWNRLARGRWLDVFITHAPPLGIHNGPDRVHTGFQVYLDIIRHFKPRYLLHGHHHAHSIEVRETRYLDTTVINVYPYRIIELDNLG
jgi:Icc-related predicted phosphoesterase